MKRSLSILTAFFIAFSILASAGYCKELKIGYVDLRKAFYEYQKTQTLEKNLNKLTETSQERRNKKIEAITKLRDEVELLSGAARNKKEKEIDEKLVDLQDFDRTTRQDLLNKKNDMFREVVDDIQKIVENMGKKGGYDYVIDSRNIMYANEAYDLTEQVLKQLNK